MNKNLEILDLINYKKQNPVKFEQKFGDLDLENIPDGFDSKVYRVKLVEHTRLNNNAHKIYLKNLQPVQNVQGGAEIKETPVVEEGVEEQEENVDGGETLENNNEE